LIEGKQQNNIKSNINWETKTSGRLQSSWFATAASLSPQVGLTKLTRNIFAADVVIVGAGISGITTAYLLSKAGKKVVVLEDGRIASGETGRTTAHITNALDDRYYNLEKLHGKQGIQKAAESHTAAISLIESIVNEEQIDCDFKRVDGFLFLDPSDKKESLHKELEATHDAGIMNTKIVERAPLNSFDTGPCLLFPNQAQFHPLNYIASLVQAIRNKYDGEIFIQTHAEEISLANKAIENENEKSDIKLKTSDGYSISSNTVVIATNAPVVVDDETSKLYDKQEAYRTYVIGAYIKKDSIPKALYWDSGNQNSKNKAPPYHYVRIQETREDDKRDLLVVGGEDHKTGNIGGQNGKDFFEERFKKLESWTRERFPIEGEIKYRWSGQIMEPIDSLAFIGRKPGNKNKNIFIATGDSGNGITHGTIAGIILSDLILGRNNPWTDIYSPARDIQIDTKGEDKKSSVSQQGTKETEKDKDDKSIAAKRLSLVIDNISFEEGAVIEDNKVALYKDQDGELRIYSSICTHLGCPITWNAIEKSFDCPCHGSRFSAITGNVINGPANSGLELKEE
jgi:glycine/D-amino acid oxidase-like deaminating enzyme/nitrite reductase/ring-hydroxylating ferredoxin subunit